MAFTTKRMAGPWASSRIPPAITPMMPATAFADEMTASNWDTRPCGAIIRIISLLTGK